MPYLIGTMWYPSHVLNDVVKKFLKITKNYPPMDDVFTQLCAPIVATKEGLKCLIIRETKKGKFEEAMTYLTKFYNEFLEIEGFEYYIEVWHTFEEAMAIGEIEVPE
jgi:hypothetical protein